MPELAEVEAVRHLVEKHSLNKQITKVKVFEDDLVFVNKTNKKIQSVRGSIIHKVCRKGKMFWLELSKSPHISFHLGMTGRVIVRGQNDVSYCDYYLHRNREKEYPPKFVKLILSLDDGTEIAVTNTQRLGRIRLHKDLPWKESPITELGIDPMNEMCTLSEFEQKLLKRTSFLKSILLNQSFFCGIGNWIADELCYQSGVDPSKRCKDLTKMQIECIYESLLRIIKFAVSVNANFTKYPSNWLFHYRWNKRIKKEDLEHHSDAFGNRIIYQKVGGRTTAIVQDLQSKENGYRKFVDSKEIGMIESFKDKQKWKNQCKLIIPKPTNAKKRKPDEQMKNDEPSNKKRKIYQITTLRRSARLASKR